MSDKQQEKRERRIEKSQKQEEEQAAERKSMMKKGLIALVILLAIPAFAYLGTLLSKPTEGLDDENKVEVVDSDNIKGPADAKVTIIEYSDFQCPACGAYFPVLEKVQETFPNDVRVVYRHFPLSQIHVHAQRAAEATEAASKQGSFFAMHDKLFENQEVWSTSENIDEVFLGYAQEIGLDIDRYTTDIDSTEVADRVENDVKSAYTLNISSTPTFFLNGSKIQNPNGFEAFKKVIEDELGQASEENIESEEVSHETKTEDTEEVVSEEIEYSHNGTLLAVDGGSGAGSVKSVFTDSYMLTASINSIPDPEEGFFYEGWIVRSSPLDVVSTGKLSKKDGSWVNTFTSEKDLTDHTKYVLTIEPDDNDPAPADHVVEGDIVKK